MNLRVLKLSCLVIATFAADAPKLPSIPAEGWQAQSERTSGRQFTK
jgi:hypothetical protein